VADNNPDQVSKVKPFFLQFSVFFVMMIYPLLSMTWRHQYPSASLEVLLFFATISVLSMLLALVTLACRPWLANIIVAVCITLVMVLQFDLLFEGAALLLLVTVLVALVTGRKLHQLVIVVFVAVIIGAFIDSQWAHARNFSEVVKTEKQSSLTPVVHIILDGFIGPDGLPPQSLPQSLRSEMIEFFRKHNFEIYNRAYSHFHATQDSLTQAFNFTNNPDTVYGKSTVFHTNLSVFQNRYFEILSRQGYAINIYQSQSFDFCQAVSDLNSRCFIYTIPNFETIRENVSNPVLRFRIMVTNLFNQSTTLSMFLFNRGWMSNWGTSHYQPKVIDQIGDDLEVSRGGVFFAHLLLPHAPFVYQNNCQLDYKSEPWERYPSSGLDTNTRDLRIARYVRYLPQAKCALNEIERLFDRMRELDIYDDAFIIVHGDHGSGLSLHSASRRNQDKLTPEDYRDVYSTLFVIKSPGGEYREHIETVSLNVLMKRATMKIIGQDQPEQITGVDTEVAPFVYLFGQIPLFRQDGDIFASP
jgi:hypothetical protein